MADHLNELLSPYIASSDVRPHQDATMIQYLNRLPTLSLKALQTTERQSLTQSAHSTLLSLQALSNRSHKAFITSADNLASLQSFLPRLICQAQDLRKGIPKLDEKAVQFSSKYSRAAENATIDQRKKVMRLSRNVDRISDILELPTLLATAVSSAAANSGNAGASFSTTYSAALDLYAHIKRLQTLYPDSPLVKDVAIQAKEAMREMASNLIGALRAQNLRLAAAMRTVGWFRRISPELDALHDDAEASAGGSALDALFLVCRLANLVSTLEALDPLKELADQEIQRRAQSLDQESGHNSWAAGHQTEKYLKRYIEIFREQSFAIVSLYKNIFAPEQSEPETAAVPGVRGIGARLKTTQSSHAERRHDPFQCLPPALATFPTHLVQLLTDTLRMYLPNIQDKTARESLLTQVLYCAASLGRLGGDFSMVLSELADTDNEEIEGLHYEWEEIMRKHRALAGRLEQLTGTNSTGPTGSSKSTLQSTPPAAA
ncbi:Dor1-like family-domain-containing protein [Aspergillus pseudoustus]|uniref:Conserved oligomeric Golgi complex subunit 8 n=1 Tax=Aspergillus pseudoustus TaxID=1810923 RepID=A0ABR4KQ07_9EURO